MPKTTSLTVRIPEDLKQRIERRAEREHRSLSAQVEHELAQALSQERAPGPVKAGKLLGRYPGRRIPAADDFAAARELLWSRLQLERR
ncbi:MAG TPA: Arc family DNA-binding protein [Polyangiales bacterium]|nr:Arc family DNA-binding protein [Polyangiales bacterium]